MGTIALQIERVPGGTVANGQNVIFDSTVYTAGNISYNSLTGVITFQVPGRYIVNWWVATQSSASTNGAAFTLSSSQGDNLPACSSVKTGEVTGVGIVNVTAVPVTASLVNTSTSTFFYGTNIPLRATLVIVEDTVPTIPAQSMACFAVAQFTNFLSQMIVAYPSTTWTVYSQSLASFSGTPLDLYTSPNASAPGILRLFDSSSAYEALPISHITAIYPGDGTVYDPSFTFLPNPEPLPQACDTDLIAAIQSYLPLGTSVSLNLGPNISASGDVYRNEYGLLILSDADGNTPIPIFTPNLLRIYTTTDPTAALGKTSQIGSGTKPAITIIKE